MICLEGLTFTYRNQPSGGALFAPLSHTFPDGRVTAVMGESGVGKTTLLNLLAKILTPADGILSGAVTGNENGCVYLFQEDRLLPALTVFENIAVVADEGKSKRGVNAADFPHRKRILAILGAMGIADSAFDSIDKLSGGMKRRVALARALFFATLPQNALLPVLLDEPFKGLDAETAAGVSAYLFAELTATSRPVIFVTHSDAEAAPFDILRVQPTRERSDL